MLGIAMLLGPFPLDYSVSMPSRQSQTFLSIAVVYMGKLTLMIWGTFLHRKWEVVFIPLSQKVQVHFTH